MDKLLNKTMIFLQRNNEDMNEDDIAIVRYGLEIFFIKLLFTVVVLIIGALLNSFFECLVFTVLFSVIRSQAGGYHAKTRIQCFLQSILTFIIVLSVLKLINIFPYLIFPLLIIALPSIFIIFRFAPIDTENKRLDEDEHKKFRKKTRIMLCFEIILAMVTYIIGLYAVSCSAMLALISTALLMIIELMKNKIMRKTL